VNDDERLAALLRDATGMTNEELAVVLRRAIETLAPPGWTRGNQ
jgi:hypothetical protein